MDIKKALDLSSSASAYLFPQVVDGAIRDFASSQPVLYNLVNKRPWATNMYYIQKKITLPTAVWSTDGGPLPSATHSEFAPKVGRPMSYLYTRGEVTGPMIAAAGSVFDALAMDIEDHQQAIVQQLSTDLVTGDGANGGIQGVLYQITDDSVFYTQNGGASPAIVDAAGAYLSLNLMDKAIDAAKRSSGRVLPGAGATTIVTTAPVKRMINSLLQAQQQFVNVTEVAAGFRVMTYDGLPIIEEGIWQDDDTILFFDANKADLLVHKDWTYEELAKTRDSVDYFITGYFGFALNGAASILKNFTISAGI